MTRSTYRSMSELFRDPPRFLIACSNVYPICICFAATFTCLVIEPRLPSARVLTALTGSMPPLTSSDISKRKSEKSASNLRRFLSARVTSTAYGARATISVTVSTRSKL